MRGMRSVLAVAMGLVVALTLPVAYWLAGSALGPAMATWADQHRGPDDGLTPAAEATMLATIVTALFVAFALGASTAAVIAATNRFRHGLTVGLIGAGLATALLVWAFVGTSDLGLTAVEEVSNAVTNVCLYVVPPVLGAAAGGLAAERLALRWQRVAHAPR